jgi:nucleotide-binding universal stress UspA family protein
MEKILVPVDGSESSANAVRFAVDRAKNTPEVHLYLLNVQEQPPVEVMVEAGIAPETWQATHQEAGRGVLESACKVLGDAGVPYTTIVAVGNPVEQIAARCQSLGCTSIVMGTRGMGSFANLVLGSVATRVVHSVSCPVTLVK